MSSRLKPRRMRRAVAMALAGVTFVTVVVARGGTISAKRCQEECDADLSACLSQCDMECYNDERCAAPCRDACYPDYSQCTSGAYSCGGSWVGQCIIDITWLNGIPSFVRIETCWGSQI